MFDLQGKVVLATGSNSGIGLGLLQGCAKHGASVVVWGRRTDNNAAAVEALRMRRTVPGPACPFGDTHFIGQVQRHRAASPSRYPSPLQKSGACRASGQPRADPLQ